MKRDVSALENLTADFAAFWNYQTVSAFGQLLSGLALGVGVWVAYRQLHAWRDELTLRKRAEIAEELLAICLTVSDALTALRSPFDSIPQEELGNKKFVLERRYQRFVEKNDIFQELRKAQVRAEAVLDDTRIDSAVNVLFEIRNSAMLAIDMLSDERDLASEDQETKELYKRLKRDMYGSYTVERDPLGMKQVDAIESIKKILGPTVRFQ